MIDIVEEKRSSVSDLCRRCDVKTLELFGSGADGTFDPAHSDLDFLVEFLPEGRQHAFARFFDLKEGLEKLFGRRVDLVFPNAVRNRFFLKSINAQRQVLYAA